MCLSTKEAIQEEEVRGNENHNSEPPPDVGAARHTEKKSSDKEHSSASASTTHHEREKRPRHIAKNTGQLISIVIPLLTLARAGRFTLFYHITIKRIGPTKHVVQIVQVF